MTDDILDDGAAGVARANEHLSQGAASSMLRALKWGKIYFYGFGGLVVLQLLVMAFVPGMLGEASAIFGFVFLIGITGLIIGYPAYKFYVYLSQTSIGINRSSQEPFVEGITALKSAIKYIAILTFVVIALYAGLFFLGLAGALVGIAG